MRDSVISDDARVDFEKMNAAGAAVETAEYAKWFDALEAFFAEDEVGSAEDFVRAAR
jgi:hypothetical protein